MERKVPIEEAPEYSVSDRGLLYVKDGSVSRCRATYAGYVRVFLHHEGTRICRGLHILVAKAFVPNPEGKPYVNHINGIRDDNRAENLEWVTASENNHRQVFPNKKNHGRQVAELTRDGKLVRIWTSAKSAADGCGLRPTSITKCCQGKDPTAGGRKWKYYEDLEEADPNEKWANVVLNAQEYSVSTLGRVKYPNGRLARGTVERGYLHITVGGRAYTVHRLVAGAFCKHPTGCDIVNHRDGDRTNNVSANLEWVTQKENMQHAVRTGAIPTKAVQRIMDDGTVQVYASIAEASTRTGLTTGCICNRCKRSGTGWTYVEPDAEHYSEFTLDDVYPSSLDEPRKMTAIADDDPIWNELYG